MMAAIIIMIIVIIVTTTTITATLLAIKAYFISSPRVSPKCYEDGKNDKYSFPWTRCQAVAWTLCYYYYYLSVLVLSWHGSEYYDGFTFGAGV